MAGTIYEALWEKGIQPEVVTFLQGLNWWFIIMSTIILYGIKHTNEFLWYDNLLNKIKIERYKNWIACTLTGAVFCLFTYMDPSLYCDVPYVSSLLRSIFFVVIFSNIFVDIPVFLIKRLGKIVDQKEVKEEKKVL